MGTLALLFAAGLIAASLTVWAKVAAKWRLGSPLIAYEPRRAATWNIVDLLAIVVCYVLTNIAIFVVLHGAVALSASEPSKAEEAAAALVATSLTNLLTMGLAMLWIHSRTGATWADLGFGADRTAGDLKLGLATFAAVSIPVYALQGLLSQFVTEQHPIIDLLQKNREPWLLAVSGVSAVIVAPLAEEFFFRVLLQSWLESLVIRQAPPLDSFRNSSSGELQDASLLAGPADPNNPYSPSPSIAEPPSEQLLPAVRAADPPAARYWVAGVRWDRAAVVFSSAIFALVHLGHGAAPIPLFFLALALGYLYQRTGRLLPSVTVHFCLNACSLAQVYLGLSGEIK
jgi:membrane protease YdiL (CAAX protease family)